MAHGSWLMAVLESFVALLTRHQKVPRLGSTGSEEFHGWNPHGKDEARAWFRGISRIRSRKGI